MNKTELDHPSGDPQSLALKQGHACSSIVSALRTLQVADVDKVRSLFAHDVLVRDRRERLKTEFDDASSLLAALALYGVDEFQVRLLSVRGDHHALVRLRFNRSDLPVSDTLVVAEADDEERLSQIVVFDQTNLRGASIELARLFRERLNAAQRTVFDITTTFAHALLARDHETVAALMSANLVLTDYREGEVKEAQRLDTLTVVTGILEDEPQFVDFAPEIHLITADGLVASRTVAERHALGLGEIDIGVLWVRDGVLVRMELYDDDDLERAIANLRVVSPTS